MAQTTVSTFQELKNTIENTDVQSILLSQDVTFTSGIKVPTTKKTLVIDLGGHTVTDMNSSSYTDALYIPSAAGSTSVTVENGVWSGRNYYGVICVYDDSANNNVIITLKNLTYRGPQAVYNRYGSTIIDGCAFSIEKNGASASSQEFGEVNKLTFLGKTEITSATTANAVLWFPFANAALTVGENASLTISAPQTYLVYSDSAAKPSFTFGQNSHTRITTKNGLFYSSGSGAHIASSCKIENGATFYAAATANNGVPLFKCSGNFTVSNGASVFLITLAKGSSPLLYLSTAATVSFSNPKNVVFYSDGGKVFSFGAGSQALPNTVTISAKQLNFWSLAKSPFSSAGGFDDFPASSFLKADDSSLNITEKLTSSAVLSIESNLADGDKGYPAESSNFDLTKAAVLAFGELPLDVSAITDLSEEIKGTTDPLSSVIYTVKTQSLDGKATDTGEFSLPLSEKPTVGETINVKVNSNFLTSSIDAEVSGSVSVTYLPDIAFNAFAVPRYNAPIKRLDDWYLEIIDTRTNGGKWSLYVELTSPLQYNNEKIENAVVFDENGKSNILNDELLLVKSGVTDSPQKIRISWQEAEGILLAIGATEIYEKGKYSAMLKWSVVPD